MQHEVAGIVEIDFVIRIAAGIALDIVIAAHPDHAPDRLGMPEGKVHRVVGAQAGTGNDQKRVAVQLGAER